MSDNAVAVVIIIAVFSYFIADHLIDAWRERGIAKYKALHAGASKAEVDDGS